MGANDRVLLDKLLEQLNAEQAPLLSSDKFFEFFAVDQILKDYDLSPDEIRAGIVDGAHDGGLDAIYVFVNGHLLSEDDTLESVRKDVSIELICIQAKNTGGFGEDALDKMRSSAEVLMNFSVSLSGLHEVYNDGVLKAFGRFRDAYGKLASRLPRLSVSYYYVTKASEVHDNVERKVISLDNTLRGLFSELSFAFHFLKDKDLVSLARQKPRATRNLVVTQQPLQSKDAFICLVRLNDLFDFVTDHGKLARHIFDSNVRDHQGRTEVNSEIQKTLESTAGTEEFWWLNNGVTILSDSARFDGKGILVENPQIVNGVQSSTEIFNYFASLKEQRIDSRSILVRVLVPSDGASQDRIIKATNSQNAVAAATLRSTEKIHRDIEQFFLSHDLFYDRRKNYYKNDGRPLSKIIGIPYLAQAVMAIALRRPDSARARPSSLLKTDDQYAKVFSDKHPLELYLVCARTVRRVDEFLNAQEWLDRKDLTNVRYYVAMLVAMTATGVPQPKIGQISAIQVDKIDDAQLKGLLDEVLKTYRELGASDQVAKGPELSKELASQRLSEYVAAKKAKITAAALAKARRTRTGAPPS
jgi:hypothetical protein